jgi:hypothetical protein
MRLAWRLPDRGEKITPAQVRGYVLAFQQKFRTLARPAVGIHFRCFMEYFTGYTPEEQAVWKAAEEDSEPMEDK